MPLALDPPAVGSVHTAAIESIAAGGAGVARWEGRAVFIPRTAPGDRVRFRVSADKGKFFRGELMEVIEAGPARREPPCPHWAECGGCPLQQMAPAAQIEAKRRIFLDALARIGKLPPPEEVSVLGGAPETGYRLRVRFQIRGGAIGFFAPGSRRLVPLEGCLLAEPAVGRMFDGLRRFLRSTPEARAAESVEVTALGPEPEEGAGLFLHPLGARDRRPMRLERGTRRAWEAFAREAGAPIAFAGERAPDAPPAWTARYEVEGAGGTPLTLRVSPEAFLQPNRAGNRLLVRALRERARPAEGGRAVDLFCGAGNFTLALASAGARVVGVEENPYACADARANARETGLAAEILGAAAGRRAEEEIEERLGGAPDLVLLDPPRRGAREAIPLIRKLGAPRVVYISCNPATLARDARELTEGGYRLEAAALIPMFPHTAHVETLTAWRREDPSGAADARPNAR